MHIPLIILVAWLVFTAMGRILLSWIDALGYTKMNLLVFVIGANVGAWLFSMLLFLAFAIWEVHLSPRGESGPLFFSWFVGGALGGTGLAWLKIRLTRKSSDKHT